MRKHQAVCARVDETRGSRAHPNGLELAHHSPSRWLATMSWLHGWISRARTERARFMLRILLLLLFRGGSAAVLETTVVLDGVFMEVLVYQHIAHMPVNPLLILSGIWPGRRKRSIIIANRLESPLPPARELDIGLHSTFDLSTTEERSGGRAFSLQLSRTGGSCGVAWQPHSLSATFSRCTANACSISFDITFERSAGNVFDQHQFYKSWLVYSCCYPFLQLLAQDYLYNVYEPRSGLPLFPRRYYAGSSVKN